MSRNDSNLPMIIVLAIGNEACPLIQEYPEYATVMIPSYDVEEIYKAHEDNPAPFFLLLNEGTDFVDNTVLQTMLEPLLEYKEVGYTYSDLLINTRQSGSRPIFFPSFSPYATANLVVNTPFLYRSPLLPELHPGLHTLYMHWGLASLWKRAIGYHIPQCLFSSAGENQNHKEDLEIIHNERQSS